MLGFQIRHRDWIHRPTIPPAHEAARSPAWRRRVDSPHLRALIRPDHVTPPSSDRNQLIALLAALEDPPRAAGLPADEAVLLAVARHHRLTPLLSAACGPHLPPKLSEIFRRDRLITAARNILLCQVAEEVLLALARRRRSDHRPQRARLRDAHLYRLAGARPTSDIDLLVPRRTAPRGPSGCWTASASSRGPRRARLRRAELSRGGLDPEGHRGRSPPGLGPAGALPDRLRCRVAGGRGFLSRPNESAGPRSPPRRSLPRASHGDRSFRCPGHLPGRPGRSCLPPRTTCAAPEETARRWRCERPLETATALTAEFLPGWAEKVPPIAVTAVAQTVIAGYGTTARLPRRRASSRLASCNTSTRGRTQFATPRSSRGGSPNIGSNGGWSGAVPASASPVSR